MCIEGNQIQGEMIMSEVELVVKLEALSEEDYNYGCNAGRWVIR